MFLSLGGIKSILTGVTDLQNDFLYNPSSQKDNILFYFGNKKCARLLELIFNWGLNTFPI